jgi:alpha-mannosidase
MKKIHLISNAHIDPVWQWQWQEGAGTAITTFSAAADFCDEFEHYIFCHNEALLYQWVEQFDPELFERIRGHVKSGKWKIIGGWYIQPDCNMPSGESIIRQIVTGINYFKEKFENFEMPTVAVNFDTFGHSKGLVQILNDAGYNAYFCTRPFGDLKDRNMRWKGFNSSEVIVHRCADGYNTFLGKVTEKLTPYIEKYPDADTGLFLWGVGNHGGGPTRIDYADLTAYAKAHGEIEFVHSTPEAYLKDIVKNKSGLSEIDELNYTLEGCYTSLIRIKQLHQKLENKLYMAEKMTAHALASGMKGDFLGLKAAERDLLFSEFHDILPGTVVKSSETDAISALHHGIEETENAMLKAFFTLTRGQKKAAEGEFPLLVYNPHPYTVEKIVSCEFMLADQNRSLTDFYDVEAVFEGKKLLSQLEKEESSIPIDWRKKIAFAIKMKPFSVNRVSLYPKMIPAPVKSVRAVGEMGMTVKGRDLTVKINGKTGLVDGITVNGREYSKAASFNVSAIKSCCDPWGFEFNSYKEKLGEFLLMTQEESAVFSGVAGKELVPLRIIEDGEVRTIVEACFTYNASRLLMTYTLPKSGTELAINIKLYNAERDTKFRINFNSALRSPKAYGKTMFALNELPTDGNEVAAQDYALLSDGASAVSVNLFGNYGLNISGPVISSTLINSVGYAAHPIDDRVVMKQDRFGERSEQGLREFKFIYNFSDSKSRFDNIEFESLINHQEPYAMSFFPTGNGAPPIDFLKIDNKKIAVSAYKPAEKIKDCYVLRLYNSVNGTETATLDFPAFNLKERVELKPFEFQSYLVKSGSFAACNCLEEKD